MTPDERQLIGDLFDRMRSVGASDKDREAESFISQSVRQTPDAAYLLVQSVLVQEGALQEAGARIDELEERVRQLEDMLADNQPRQSGGGSFLGGARGGGRPGGSQYSSGSVPPIGSRSTPSTYEQPERSGWQPSSSAERMPPQEPLPAPQAPQQRSGGGFLRGAMAAAAGVAGGMLLSDTIRGMMGGGSGAHASGKDASNAGKSSPFEVNRREPQYQDPDDNDPGNTDLSDMGGGGSDIEL